MVGRSILRRARSSLSCFAANRAVPERSCVLPADPISPVAATSSIELVERSGAGQAEVLADGLLVALVQVAADSAASPLAFGTHYHPPRLTVTPAPPWTHRGGGHQQWRSGCQKAWSLVALGYASETAEQGRWPPPRGDEGRDGERPSRASQFGPHERRIRAFFFGAVKRHAVPKSIDEINNKLADIQAFLG